MVNSTPIVIRSLVGAVPAKFPRSDHGGRNHRRLCGLRGQQGQFRSARSRIWSRPTRQTRRKSPSVAARSRAAWTTWWPRMAMQAAGEGPDQGQIHPLRRGRQGNGRVAVGRDPGAVDRILRGRGHGAGRVRSRIIGVTSADSACLPPMRRAHAEGAGLRRRVRELARVFRRPGSAVRQAPDAYIAKLSEKMYDTPEWEAVRARNGWVNIYNPGDEVHGLPRENRS